MAAIQGGTPSPEVTNRQCGEIARPPTEGSRQLPTYQYVPPKPCIEEVEVSSDEDDEDDEDEEENEPSGEDEMSVVSLSDDEEEPPAKRTRGATGRATRYSKRRVESEEGEEEPEEDQSGSDVSKVRAANARSPPPTAVRTEKRAQKRSLEAAEEGYNSVAAAWAMADAAMGVTSPEPKQPIAAKLTVKQYRGRPSEGHGPPRHTLWPGTPPRSAPTAAAGAELEAQIEREQYAEQQQDYNAAARFAPDSPQGDTAMEDAEAPQQQPPQDEVEDEEEEAPRQGRRKRASGASRRGSVVRDDDDDDDDDANGGASGASQPQQRERASGLEEMGLDDEGPNGRDGTEQRDHMFEDTDSDADSEDSEDRDFIVDDDDEIEYEEDWSEEEEEEEEERPKKKRKRKDEKKKKKDKKDKKKKKAKQEDNGEPVTSSLAQVLARARTPEMKALGIKVFNRNEGPVICRGHFGGGDTDRYAGSHVEGNWRGVAVPILTKILDQHPGIFVDDPIDPKTNKTKKVRTEFFQGSSLGTFFQLEPGTIQRAVGCICKQNPNSSSGLRRLWTVCYETKDMQETGQELSFLMGRCCAHKMARERVGEVLAQKGMGEKALRQTLGQSRAQWRNMQKQAYRR